MLYRVFVAVDITDSNIKNVILNIQQELSKLGIDAKPVEPENLHITLRFIGEVHETIVNEIINRLKTVKYGKFKMRLKGLGAFPSIGNPRVVWIGVEEGSKELKELHEIVEKLVGKFGIKDEKEFTPHLTFARIKSNRNINLLKKYLTEHQDLDLGYQEVDSIKLKRSILTPKGPIYSDLLEVKLE